MTLNTSTLRPGLLVSMKTSVTGNVRYFREDIQRQKVTKDGRAESEWNTKRTIADHVEHEEAIKTRTKVRVAITKVCASSAFGLLCPESDAAELEAAIKEARQIAADFNETAKLTRVTINVLTGRIAADDVEAVKAINSEVADLLRQMEDGVKNLDVKSIRDAAQKARGVGMMLTEESSTRVNVAIEAARKAATAIKKAGDQAAAEVDLRTVRKLKEARTAFLEIGDDEPKQIAKPAARGRAVAFRPEEPAPVK